MAMVPKSLILGLFCIKTSNLLLLGWKLLKEGETAKIGTKSHHQ
jgi:hypothetical protein